MSAHKLKGLEKFLREKGYINKDVVIPWTNLADRTYIVILDKGRRKGAYKLKSDVIMKIKNDRDEGMKIRDIAKKYGICEKTVRNYLKL